MADNSDKAAGKKVDEGWKEQARREQEEAAGRGARATGETAATGATGETGAGDGYVNFPEPSFLGLIAELAARASIYLGFVENPITGKMDKNMEGARHVIDTLEMLQEKTRGNLEEMEEGYLNELLYSLKMEYVRQNK